MEIRLQVLSELRNYIENIDNEATLLLQNLQWDAKHLTQATAMTTCKYDINHRIPLLSKQAHEEKCYLTHEGYDKKDILLPDPVDPGAKTVVRLRKQDITQIINKASSTNPTFNRVFYGIYSESAYQCDIRRYIITKTFKLICCITQGVGCKGAEPLSVDRLQQVYSADERRAIHDAVVEAAPFCHDLTDLALPSSNNEAQTKMKSRMEILAELRDMKRRRTKYRVAAKTSNYSHVLRDVIKTQMELYAEAKGIFIKTDYGSKSYISLNKSSETSHGEEIARNIDIKQEIMLPDNNSSKGHLEHNRDNSYNSKRTRHNERERSEDYDIKHNKSNKDRKRNDLGHDIHNPTNDKHQYVDDRPKHNRLNYKSKQEEQYKDRNNYHDSQQSDASRNGSERYDQDYNKLKSKYNERYHTYDKYRRHKEGECSRDKKMYDQSEKDKRSSSSKKRKYEHNGDERSRRGNKHQRYYDKEKYGEY